MLFSGMNRAPEASRTETWSRVYKASWYRKEFVTGRSGKHPPQGPKPVRRTPVASLG